MGGGGKSSTSTSQVQIPASVLANYNAAFSQAQTTAQAPFQQYTGQFVSPLTPTQTAGIANTNAAANQAQPYFAQAAGQTAAAAQPITAANINQYMSPYLSDVAGSTEALLNQQNQQAMAGQLGNAITSGAFGGDRAGIAAANLAQQQELAGANIYSGIEQQGYNTALSTAQQQQQVGLQGAEQLAGLGAGAQTAALEGAQAQLGAGQVQQQTGQALDTALYQQFLQQQSYPFQVAQFLANVAEGTGSLSGSTTTTQQPGGFFSDERLKEDIETVGKTFDGQNVIRFRYKGDKRPQIGLSAQQVEKKHPDAVTLEGDYRVVDYGKALDAAADRGHFAGGGATLGDLAAILQAQQQMYAPYAGSGLYGASAAGSPRGASSYVPPATLPVAALHTASVPQSNTQTPLQNMQTLASLGKNVGEIYKDWNAPAANATAPKPAAAQVPAAPPSPPPSPAPAAPAATAPSGSLGDTYNLADSDPWASRGGRQGYSQGGLPYTQGFEGSEQIDIPGVATAGSGQELQPAQPSQQKNPSGLQNLTGLAALGGLGVGAASEMGLFDAAVPAAELIAAKRGGRIGYDDGGSPTDDNIAAPPPAELQKPSLADLSATTEAAPTPKASIWDRVGKVIGSLGDTDLAKTNNLIPLMTGIAAMGTAPTRSLGVALASGLGAGAQSYMGTQQQQANIGRTQAEAQGINIANQIAQMKAKAAQDYLNPGASAPQQTAPASTAAPSDPYGYRQQYFVNPGYLPNEQDAMQRAIKSSMVLGNAPVEAVKQQHDQRVLNQTAANQNSAQAEADRLYAVATNPADPAAQQEALARYNAVHQWTGDKYEDSAGARINSRTGAPAIGVAAQGLTPEQAVTAQQRWAAPVDTGAPARPSLAQFAHGQGATAPTVTAPPAAAPVAPGAAAAAQSKVDVSDAPNRPSFLTNPNAVLTDSQKSTSAKYAEADQSLRDEANRLPQTQQELVKTQRVLNILPNAKTGPGTEAMSAVQTALGNMTGSQFSDWLNSNPSAYAILSKQLGTNALDTTLKNLHDQGANVRLGQQESRLIIGTLSASTEMPKDAIRSLLDWQVEQAKYDMGRQNAIQPYLDGGKDARAFDNWYSQKHPLQSAVSTGAPSGTTVDQFQVGKTYVDSRGNRATYLGNGKWK